MPLTDLIRYFNAGDDIGDSTLYLEGDRAAACHRGLRLTSLFRPVADLGDSRFVGHEARLAARHEDGTPVAAATAYTHADTPEALVHFDRLVRTLHALNFLVQRRHAGGWLQVAVHPRHLLAVPNQHGLVYEAILKRCGLAPEDIVLEIDARRIGHHPHLTEAIASYRRRGYRLALGNLDPATDADLPGLLRPDLLRLAVGSPEILHDAARRAGIAVECDNIETTGDYHEALAAGSAFGLGDLFGQLQGDCRRTHTTRRLA